MTNQLDLAFLAQADAATLKLELARHQLDAAKAAFEAAKLAHEEMLGRAESHGLPKAKLRKLTEERINALVESGLLTGLLAGLSAGTGRREAAKPEARRAKKVSRADGEIVPETWGNGENREHDAEIMFLGHAKAGVVIEAESAAQA